MVCGRQEVRLVERGASLLTWVAVLEGSIGSSLLNSYHFFKVTQQVTCYCCCSRTCRICEHKKQRCDPLFALSCKRDHTGYVLLPQGSLLTPVGLRYTAGGEAHSAVLGSESVEMTLRLSAAQEADVLYLLAWEMDFKTHNTTNKTADSKYVLLHNFFRILKTDSKGFLMYKKLH